MDIDFCSNGTGRIHWIERPDKESRMNYTNSNETCTLQW